MSDPASLLEHLRTTRALGCQRCRLCLKRNFLVFGSGNVQSPLALVGEAPSDQENRSGEPFVGPAGQMLDSLCRKAGVDRKSFYTMNVLKCWLPDNREPEPDEITACAPFLHLQAAILQPKIFLALGRVAGAVLSGLSLNTPVGRMRDQDLVYQNEVTGVGPIPVIVTYHPAYILRNTTTQPLKAKGGAKAFMDDLRRAISLANIPA